jgi:predicted protein tyrosine phosphatase
MIQRHTPEVLILSEMKALLYEPSLREACISVTDIDDKARPELSNAFTAVLRLAFSDIDEPSSDPADLLFNEEHAREIVNFVRPWTDVDRIVIHCLAGQSRSPGIAMGLCELFSWELGEMEERYPYWNPWVRTELVRVGREMLLRQA